jgi:hypothetical protein
MAMIEIISITGTSPYQVYVSDVYGNNEYFVGTISGAVPPTENFYLPTLFNNAPAIMLTITDANGCSKFKILQCRYGCGFTIQIVASDCVFTIALDNPDCIFDTMVS